MLARQKKNQRVTVALEKWSLPAPPGGAEENWYIDLSRDPQDYHVALLASMGFTYRCITQETGLSYGQVYARIKRFNAGKADDKKISARNYRNGISPVSKIVIEASARKVAQLVVDPQVRQIEAQDAIEV